MSPAVPEPLPAARIGVVIPYFQCEAGLLQRALSSVAEQEHPAVQVVIVDDGSPRAAAEEITPALHSALPGLTLIRQTNQGTAAARNAALDALTAEVTAVALLDSDDYWERSHLRNAANALSLGADFFFSNSRIEGESTNYFQRHPRRGSFERIAEAPDIMRWTDSLSALIAAGSAFATPTVVFRRALMPDVRFPVSFRRAGEDQMAFWELLVRSSVIMFCTEPTVVVGVGGYGTWRNSTLGSVANLVRLTDEIRLRQHVISTYPVTAADRRLVRRAIATRRKAALESALHLLRRRREHALSEVFHLLRADPICAVAWCAHLPHLLYRWIRAHLSGPART
ncbi:MAG TPA: glycosyltransferase family A protein [Steroidobacteraceae bacterium]|nr:glycosyltransferase family A protein [Steroidobacteraceae bacterium]